ncbi:MAG: biotin/lipoyl-binding protein [Oscillatoriaceae bacterium SKW80]|nr:biotin/lipoyl-binding protein [Oscillatoriaceae bacterium SKW80]
MLDAKTQTMPCEGIQKAAGKKRLGGNILVLAVAATLVVGSSSAYTVWRLGEVKNTPVKAAPEVSAAKVTKVTALGRLEPAGEIIKLSAGASVEGNRIEEILVKEGDRVKAGEVIAILDSRERLQAALEEAQQRVKVAEANLEKVKAGAKKGEINAQQAAIARLEEEQKNEIEAQKAIVARLEAEQENEIAAQQATIARLEAEYRGELNAQEATIARLEAELKNAESEFQRYQMLYQEGVIAAETLDSRRLAVETAREKVKEAQAIRERIINSKTQQIKEAQANLNRTISAKLKQIEEAKANLNRTIFAKTKQIEEAKATLDRIAEIRPVDIHSAQAEVDSAKAAVKQAQANLEKAIVRSPRDAQMLKIHARPGEIISSEGIAELGDTSQMYAVAEVYESDISKVRIGQKARITSESLTGELYGIVEQIGLQVKKQNVINTDPSANIDNRIIEVKVRLDEPSSQKAAKFTNLQVTVEVAI